MRKLAPFLLILLALYDCGREPLAVATNYTGVQTATQPPSATPGVNVSPTLSLPDDGDPLVAASVIQAFKAGADFIAYVNRVHHFRKTANDDVALQTGENSASKLRSFVDHLGFPFVSGSHGSEDWGLNFNTVTTTGAALLGGHRWSYDNVATSASNSIISAGATSGLFTGYAGVGLSQVLGAASVAGDKSFVFTTRAVAEAEAFASIALTFDLGVTTPGDDIMFAGFHAGQSTVPGVDNAAKVAFYKRTGDTNWFIYMASGAGNHLTDTGVAVASANARSFRIEIHGSATAYGSARARFFIDGVQVSTDQTTDVPTMPIGLKLGFGIQQVTGGTARTLNTFNTQWAQNNRDNPSAL